MNIKLKWLSIYNHGSSQIIYDNYDFDRNWRNNFFLNCVTIEKVWLYLRDSAIKSNPEHKEIHFLWTLHFLKEYETEEDDMQKWNLKCRRTHRIHVWSMIEIMQEKLSFIVIPFISFFSLFHFFLFQINWEDRYKNWKYHKPCGVVDTFPVEIETPRGWTPSTLFFCPKHHINCLKYQVVISLGNPKIIFISDAFFGSVHDKKIADLSGLTDILEENEEVCIGDPAYVGALAYVTSCKRQKHIKSLTIEQKKINLEICPVRSMVERMIQKIEVWMVNKKRWRHQMEKHCMVFKVTMMLLNFHLIDFPFEDRNY